MGGGGLDGPKFQKWHFATRGFIIIENDKI